MQTHNLVKTVKKGRNILFCFVLISIGFAVKSLAGWDQPLVISLEKADMTLVGEDNGDWAGYFASPAGDVNGDGLGDILVGAPMAGIKECPYPLEPDGSCSGLPKGQGVAYLVLGRPSQDWSSNSVNLADADASFLGCDTYSMTARQLYTAGDVNGDGYDDLLVSGWKCGENYTGKAYLILGRPDVDQWGRYFPIEQVDASFLGENEWDFLSYYVSTAGDINADGYDDMLITSTHYDITGTQIITDVGKVYLVLGKEAANWGADFPLAQADATFLGEAEGDRLGRSVTGVGDVNGDGYDDFLLGSISSDYGGEDAGQNYLFLGRPAEGDPAYDPTRPWWGLDYSVAGADASFVGEAEGDETGRRVSWAGDVNGDGLSDFLMGAALNDHTDLDAGIAHLILGRQEADWGMHFPLADADASFVGEKRRDQAGRRHSGVGDINNDGYDDFIIGAPHNSRAGFSAGSAYVIYGRPTADWGSYYPLAQADIIYEGKADIGVAGYDQGWLGDFDGDGIDDYFIAAFGGRNNEEVPGEVYLLLGNATPRLVNFAPGTPAGTVRKWHTFRGEYWEPNGPQDFDRVQLTLGRKSTTDLKGLSVSYVAQPGMEQGLYLRDSGNPGWLGPCAPGEPGRLDNGVVELDCEGSRVKADGSPTLQVTWRARWHELITVPRVFTAYLRAVDLAGNDTEFVTFGTWTLLPKTNPVMLPLIMKGS